MAIDVMPESAPVTDCLCPTCGAHFNRALGVTGSPSPKPGDVTLCIRCASVLLFDDAMRVRAPTIAELREIATNHDVIAAQNAIREVSHDLPQSTRH